MSGAIYVISWLLLAAIFVVIEIISLGLTTIWFAGGSFVAALAALGHASLPIQIILFLVVSIGLLFATRPFAKRFLDSRTELTNAEALVGCEAIVVKTVNNLEEEGVAKINGMEWTARSKNPEQIIPEGKAATVVEIQGVKLILEMKEDSVDEPETVQQEVVQTETTSSASGLDDIQIV